MRRVKAEALDGTTARRFDRYGRSMVSQGPLEPISRGTVIWNDNRSTIGVRIMVGFVVRVVRSAMSSIVSVPGVDDW